MPGLCTGQLPGSLDEARSIGLPRGSALLWTYDEHGGYYDHVPPPALTYRDANANAMIDMLDLTFPAFARPPKLAEPLEESDPAPLACNNSGPGTIPPPGSVIGP